jgi:hypothetical protein
LWRHENILAKSAGMQKLIRATPVPEDGVFYKTGGFDRNPPPAKHVFIDDR